MTKDCCELLFYALLLLFLSVILICITVAENKEKDREQRLRQYEKMRLDVRIEALAELEARRLIEEHIADFHSDKINLKK